MKFVSKEAVVDCIKHLSAMLDDWEGEPLRVRIHGQTYFYQDMEDIESYETFNNEQEMCTSNPNVVIVRVYPITVNRYKDDITEHFIDFHLKRTDPDLIEIVKLIENEYKESYVSREEDDEDE